MSDNFFGLNGLSVEIHEIAKSKGFWDKPAETGTLLMLCVSELGEALEADRKEKHADVNSFLAERMATDNYTSSFEHNIKDTFEDELADTVIRILDICASRSIDIDYFIRKKMEYNSTRPMMHGKKY